MNEIERIKEYFKGATRKPNYPAIMCFFKKNEDIKKYCEDILKDDPFFESINNVLKALIFDEQLKHCKTCGKKMYYSKINYDFCCRSCAVRNEETIQKYKKTNLERYGNECPAKTEEIKKRLEGSRHKKLSEEAKERRNKKFRKTCLERYGVDNVAKLDETKEKQKKTFKEHYGVEWGLQAKEVKEKTKITCLEKYGVEHISQNEGVKKKINDTTIAHFGGIGYASKEINDKIKNTNLEKYGVEYPAQNEEIYQKVVDTQTKLYGGIGCGSPIIAKKIENTLIEKYGSLEVALREINKKAKKTNIERYGTECVLQNEEIKKKVSNTNLERYGGTGYGSTEINEKIKKTNLERYGNESPIKTEKVQEKQRNTMYERYRVEYCMQSPELVEKSKETCMEKYGVEYSFQSENNREKTKETCLEKYGFEHSSLAISWNNVLSWNKYIVPNFSKEDWKGTLSDEEYEWKCVKCGNIFKQKIYCTHHLSECESIPRCLNCYPFMGGYSQSELDILEFCKSYFPSASKNDELIKPLKLDIVIPEIKLAIEFNGSYWHSMRESRYHLNKTKLCNEKGYRLIHIWEDEWRNNKEDILRRLENILKGKENLEFTDDEIILDRSWYNNIDIPGYILKEEIKPEIVIRNNFEVENCGKLIYIRINA